MKLKGVIGKKIVAVEQERCTGSYDQPVFHISKIELEDGSCILFDSEPLSDASGGLNAVTGEWVSKKERER